MAAGTGKPRLCREGRTPHGRMGAQRRQWRSSRASATMVKRHVVGRGSTTATATRLRHRHEADQKVTQDAAAGKPCLRHDGRMPRGRARAQRRRRHKRAASIPRREDVAWSGRGAVDGDVAAGKLRRSREGRTLHSQNGTRWTATQHDHGNPVASHESHGHGQPLAQREDCYTRNTK